MGNDQPFRMFLEFDPDNAVAFLAEDPALFDLLNFFIADDGACRNDHFTLRPIFIDKGNRRRQFFAVEALAPAQFLVDLVPAYISQVIPAVVGEDIPHQLVGVFQVGRFAGTQFAVDFQQGVFPVLRGILGQGSGQEGMFPEGPDNIVVSGQAHDTHQSRSGKLTGPVHTGIDDIVQIRFIFDPSAPVRNDRGAVQELAHGVLFLAIIDTGRTDQLADDDTFSTVDDEGPRIGHQREVPHEHGGFFDFAGILIQQADVHIQRSCISSILLFALFHVILGITDGEVFKTQFQIVGKIFNGGHVLEYVVQPLPNKPLIRFSLQVDQMRHLQNFFDPSITVPYTVTIMNRLKHVVSHSFSPGRFSITKKQGNQ